VVVSFSSFISVLLSFFFFVSLLFCFFYFFLFLFFFHLSSTSYVKPSLLPRQKTHTQSEEHTNC
jgi:hypothetical protein